MRMTILLVALLLQGLATPAWSQLTDPTTFEVVRIDVKGCQSTDAVAIRQLSGLGIGDKLTVPGTETLLAIRRLLAQGLFSDVQIHETRREQDLIWLEIQVTEAPRVSSIELSGLNKRKTKAWQTFLQAYVPTGSYWLAGREQTLRQLIEDRLVEENLPFDQYQLDVQVDTSTQEVKLQLAILDSVKPVLGQLIFTGNTHFSDHQLQKAMGVPRLRLASVRPTEEFFAATIAALMAHYQNHGYADVKITADEITEEGRRWHWSISIEEGRPYYFGTIGWRGARKYEEAFLAEMLGIAPGEPFSRERLQRRLQFDPEQVDISSLYMDYGHLFFQADAVEVGLRGDSIDLEIRLVEGPVALISAVHIEGNDRTSEEIIRRELYTQPGKPFSREDLIRSQRALGAMGYFRPETIEVQTDIDPASGEVAITYVLEEVRNDLFELSASINPGSSTGSGLIGTLGFSFNNFSLRGLLEEGLKGAQGDGQRLSIRAQSSGSSYQGYNFSFTEPWLNGRPQSLSIGAFHQRYTDRDSLDNLESLTVTGGQISLGRRLPWGRGGWTLQSELGYQHIRLNRLLDIDLDDGSSLNSGRFNNLYLQLQLNYQNLDDFFFPRRGSRLQLLGQWTPPFEATPASGDGNQAQAYEWLAYHKYRLTAEHYLPLGKRWAVKGSVKMGWLAGYDPNLGAPPFERFELGGNGLTGSQQAAFAGNDIFSLRGYDLDEVAGSANGGGVSFAKYTLELRHLFLNTPSAKGYLVAFGEAGNAWKSLGNFDPFDVQRSAGLGLRMQLPMFGTIGFDYGLGFDQEGFRLNRWQNYGRFNLIFGFEPE